MKAIAETRMIGNSSPIDQQVAFCTDISISSICSARANKKLSLRLVIILSQEFKVFMHHGTQKKRENDKTFLSICYIYTSQKF